MGHTLTGGGKHDKTAFRPVMPAAVSVSFACRADRGGNLRCRVLVWYAIAPHRKLASDFKLSEQTVGNRYPDPNFG